MIIACMGGIDIVVILAALIGGGTGLLFFTYWPYRAAMNNLARGPLFGKPLALFIAAMVGCAVWLGGTWMIIVAALSLQKGLEGPLIVLGVMGSLGWMVLLAAWLSTRRRREIPAAPVAPMQVWFQDLIVAVLCYASGLTIVAGFNGFNPARAEEFFPPAIYLLAAGSFGLFVALDLSRRSAWGQEPLKRASIFVGIFTLFPVTLPAAVAAYWRWRRAIRRAESAA